MSLTFSILRQFLIILHAGKANKNAFKALIVAEYTGVKIEVSENFEIGVSNKTPEFIKMNPLGKIPILETPDGAIFKSNAIARYGNPLFGSSLIEYIDTNLGNWYRPRVGLLTYFPTAEEAVIASFKRSLGALNTRLASNTYY
ncbi:hypothetical protein UlMin_041376 [Ulmus minor]